jgi:hypothetical protein
MSEPGASNFIRHILKGFLPHGKKNITQLSNGFYKAHCIFLAKSMEESVKMSAIQYHGIQICVSSPKCVNI